MATPQIVCAEKRGFRDVSRLQAGSDNPDGTCGRDTWEQALTYTASGREFAENVDRARRGTAFAPTLPEKRRGTLL